jgi:hypothetical protein
MLKCAPGGSAEADYGTRQTSTSAMPVELFLPEAWMV